MMKKTFFCDNKFGLITLLCISFLTGCGEQKTINTTAKYALPEELSDCKIFKMYPDDITNPITVVRCPQSQTTTNYKVGKSHRSISITEDNN